MVTRQATPRHTWVLLLIVPFLLPLAGCEPTTPKTTEPMTTEPTSAGTTWTVASLGAGALEGDLGDQVGLAGVAWNGTRFVAVGGKLNSTTFSADALIVHSADGTTWTASSVSGTNGNLGGVAWNGTRFVAVGDMVELDRMAAGGYRQISGMVMRSTDGLTWTSAAPVDGTNSLSGVTWGERLRRCRP